MSEYICLYVDAHLQKDSFVIVVVFLKIFVLLGNYCQIIVVAEPAVPVSALVERVELGNDLNCSFSILLL